jgi:hypothetical protein
MKGARKGTLLPRTGSAWEKLVTNLHYSPTPEGFTQAWIQACGRRPTPQQIDEFTRMVKKALGEEKPPARVKGAPKPAPQPTLWPDVKETR